MKQGIIIEYIKIVAKKKKRIALSIFSCKKKTYFIQYLCAKRDRFVNIYVLHKPHIHIFVSINCKLNLFLFVI